MSIMKDLAKLAAQKLIYTMETPREVRKLERHEKRVRREHWTTRYFGMVPLSFQIWWAKKRERHNNDTPGA